MTTVLARRILGGALATAATGTVLLTAPLPANAVNSSAEVSSVAAAATCRYVVNNTGVRARYGPDVDTEIYRTLNLGEIVSGPCNQDVWNGEEGRWWVKLYTRQRTFFVYAASEYLTPQQ